MLLSSTVFLFQSSNVLIPHAQFICMVWARPLSRSTSRRRALNLASRFFSSNLNVHNRILLSLLVRSPFFPCTFESTARLSKGCSRLSSCPTFFRAFLRDGCWAYNNNWVVCKKRAASAGKRTHEVVSPALAFVVCCSHCSCLFRVTGLADLLE